MAGDARGPHAELKQRALVQLACVKAVMASARAVEIVHAAAGTSAELR